MSTEELRALVTGCASCGRPYAKPADWKRYDDHVECDPNTCWCDGICWDVGHCATTLDDGRLASDVILASVPLLLDVVDAAGYVDEVPLIKALRALEDFR